MKRAVKIVTLVVIVSMVLSIAALGLAGCTSYDETLVVYNWEDYIDKTLLDEFATYYQQQTGKTIKVTYSTFDTNETMMTEIENGGATVDLICPSDYAIERLVNKGLLRKINKTTAMTENVNPLFETQLDAIFGSELALYDYMVPYMWGTLGILYNTNYVTEEQVAEAGWGILWNSTNIADLNGKVLMKDSVRDAFAATVFYLKEQNKLPADYADMSAQQLINTTDDALVDAVQDALAEQKASGVLKGYEVDLGKQDLVAGTAYVDLAWSGDALYAIEEASAEDGVELAYYAPTSGGNIWFDGWVIPTNAQNASAAEMFLDYMSTPEAGMRNMMEIGYTSAIDENKLLASEEAMTILADNGYDDSDAFFADISRYPDNGDISHLGVMKDFGNKETAIVAMWEEVKAQQDGQILTIVLIVLGVVLLVAIVVGVTIMIRKQAKSRRKPVRRASRPVQKTTTADVKDEDDATETEKE